MSAPPCDIKSLNPYFVYSCSPVATGITVDLETSANPCISSARTGSSNQPTLNSSKILDIFEGKGPARPVNPEIINIFRNKFSKI